MQPPAVVTSDIDALRTALLRNPPLLKSQTRLPQARSGSRRAAYYGGLPPTWRVWAEQQEKRKQKTA